MSATAERTVVRLRLRLLLLAALSPAAVAAGAEVPHRPLEIRNLAPFSALFGLPRMRGAARSTAALSLRLDHVSNFSSSSSGDTQIFQDGETSHLSLGMRFPATPSSAFDFGVELPWVRHSSGELDRLIDNFHRTFDLPEGGRDRAPRDQLDILLRVDGEAVTAVNRRRSGLGDLRLWGGIGVYGNEQRTVRLRGSIKLPTGDAERLTGSGGTDASLWLEGSERAALATIGVTVTGGAGLVRLGRGDLAARAQERWVPIGHLGLHRSLGRWHWSAQLDGHGALFDLSVDQLGQPALQGTLGVRRRFGERHELTGAIIEDLVSQSTSDVVFQLQWQTTL
ncbi:MAG: DUF3187 family protein [Pseudomonadota bacterium]